MYFPFQNSCICVITCLISIRDGYVLSSAVSPGLTECLAHNKSSQPVFIELNCSICAIYMLLLLQPSHYIVINLFSCLSTYLHNKSLKRNHKVFIFKLPKPIALPGPSINVERKKERREGGRSHWLTFLQFQ